MIIFYFNRNAGVMIGLILIEYCFDFFRLKHAEIKIDKVPIHILFKRVNK